MMFLGKREYVPWRTFEGMKKIRLESADEVVFKVDD